MLGPAPWSKSLYYNREMRAPAGHPAASSRRWLEAFVGAATFILQIAAEAGFVVVGGALAAHVLHVNTLTAELQPSALAYAVLFGSLAIRDGSSRKFSGLDAWPLLTVLLMVIIISGDISTRHLLTCGVWLVSSSAGIWATRKVCLVLAERAHCWLLHPRAIAFIGNSDSAARMLAQIRTKRHSNVLPVGYFDDRNLRPGPLTNVLPLLGTVDDLVGYIHEYELSDVYMALPWSAAERMSELLARLRFLPLTVRLLPDSIPPAIGGGGEDEFEGVVMPTLMIPPFSRLGGLLKRSIDLLAATSLLALLAPLFLLTALLIRVDSPGPIFFRQIRSGQFGKSFSIYKFRTLRATATDAVAETLVVCGDTRVTRIGRYLRRYSIDELPQVLNVLLGDMSLVGPRPHAPRAKADGRIYAEILPEYMLRYRVKPGMTGWAQVSGWRGNTDTEEQLRKRVEFDFDYISNWSLRRDFVILARTVPSMLMPSAANN